MVLMMFKIMKNVYKIKISTLYMLLIVYVLCELCDFYTIYEFMQL